MTDELKNCPFCGSDWIEAGYDASEEDHEDGAPEFFYYVSCSGCGASSDWFFSEEDAAEGWNARTDADQLAAENERLRAHLQAIANYVDNPAAVSASGLSYSEIIGGMWSQAIAALDIQEAHDA